MFYSTLIVELEYHSIFATPFIFACEEINSVHIFFFNHIPYYNEFGDSRHIVRVVKVVVVEDSVAVVVPSVVGRVPNAQPPIRGLRRSANIALNESLRSFHYLWTENAIKGILLAVSTLTIYTT